MYTRGVRKTELSLDSILKKRTDPNHHKNFIFVSLVFRSKLQTVHKATLILQYLLKEVSVHIEHQNIMKVQKYMCNI